MNRKTMIGLKKEQFTNKLAVIMGIMVATCIVSTLSMFVMWIFTDLILAKQLLYPFGLSIATFAVCCILIALNVFRINWTVKGCLVIVYDQDIENGPKYLDQYGHKTQDILRAKLYTKASALARTKGLPDKAPVELTEEQYEKIIKAQS